MMPHVVIVGGGFGGLNVARALASAPVRVTLIDQRNHHLFQPLLYQVATGGLSAPNIAAPIRKLLHRQENVRVLLDQAKRIDPVKNFLHLSQQVLSYDYLVVASGASHSYFGHEEWEKFAPGLKTVEDALEIRRRVFLAYEKAEMAVDPVERKALLTFVVIGAGPTGVELAGALAEISRLTLPGNFRSFDPRDAQVILIEGAKRVLPVYPEDLSIKCQQALQKLGVVVHLGALVTAVDAQGVILEGERLAARTVLWAAGVSASSLTRSLGVALDRAGRVLVNADLSVPGFPHIFVIGDAAALQQRGEWIPGVAQAAIQGGRQTAANLRRALRGQPTRPFHYVNLGSLATIGRAAAVADFGRVRFAGFFAWLLWLFIHILSLIGFRNRLQVMLEWAWAYFTYQRSARVILGESVPKTLDSEE